MPLGISKSSMATIAGLISGILAYWYGQHTHQLPGYGQTFIDGYIAQDDLLLIGIGVAIALIGRFFIKKRILFYFGLGWVLGVMTAKVINIISPGSVS